MSESKDILEVGDVVRVKRSPTISAYIANPVGRPLDGRIGEIDRVEKNDFGNTYEVRLWWYGPNFRLQRSQLEYLPGTHDDWGAEAMKHESLDDYFVRTSNPMSDGDPLS